MKEDKEKQKKKDITYIDKNGDEFQIIEEPSEYDEEKEDKIHKKKKIKNKKGEIEEVVDIEEILSEFDNEIGKKIKPRIKKYNNIIIIILINFYFYFYKLFF